MRTLKRLAMTASFTAILSMSAAAQAGTFTPIYNFKGHPDGFFPNDGLVILNGSLFGTAAGGARNAGSVFKIDLSTGAETILHSFGGPGDGYNPQSGLLLRADGLYGATISGGDANGIRGHGTLYRIDPSTGAETVLHRFHPGESLFPSGRLVSRHGAIYGTTSPVFSNDFGTVFKYVPETGAVSVVYTFDTTANGIAPAGGLTSDPTALYGVVNSGGTFEYGGVFKIDLATGTENLLTSFGPHGDAYFSWLDGLTVDSGELYGTSSNGGIGHLGRGTVFKVDASTGAETVLHKFATRKQGIIPRGGVVPIGSYLYGTTNNDGLGSHGTIYRVGVAHGGLRKLYDFTDTDGQPFAGLIYDHGAFYGSTIGGVPGYGMIFKFVP